MPEAGVRELKIRASEIVKQVRRGIRYVITYRGRPIATMAPLEMPETERRAHGDVASWDELDRLGAEIGKRWRSSRTSVELLSESRR